MFSSAMILSTVVTDLHWRREIKKEYLLSRVHCLRPRRLYVAAGRLSVCLSHRPIAAMAAGGFAA